MQNNPWDREGGFLRIAASSNMAKLTVLPNGNAIAMHLVTSITLHPGKGVSCRDDERRLVAWIDVEDADKARRVRETLIRLTQSGMAGLEPDWSFLEE